MEKGGERTGGYVMQTQQTEHATTTMMLQTQALTRRFGTLTAVDALSLSVKAGEVFGLLGPNGAGKSTVIKMLTTLLPPTTGTAQIAGFDLVHQAALVRRVIGYVPQMLSADAALTGYENLLVFARLYEIPRRERDTRIHEALSFMNLDEVANRLVGTVTTQEVLKKGGKRGKLVLCVKQKSNAYEKRTPNSKQL